MGRAKRARPHGRQRERPPISPTGEGSPRRIWHLPGWAYTGVGLFFAAACAFGVLEVHYSTDTWIGLAAGRQITSEPTFPITDTLSYTANGRIWFNQNWLSHVFFWLLYDKLGPSALVLGTWLLGVATFGLVLGAVRLRSGSWLGATLAAAMVGISLRDWLSIRPATVQFFLLAMLWLCLSALVSPGARRRWWPIVVLAPVLAVWPHAHGSFVWGFGLVALFLGCALLARLRRQSLSMSGRQILAVVGVGVLASVLGAVLSPYGLANYTHPLKVVESAVFRQVSEWVPPYRSASFPPVARFWLALSVAVGGPLAILVARTFSRVNPGATSTHDQAAPLVTCQNSVFDLAAVGLGFAVAMFARRFAPIFCILAAPSIVTFCLHLARPLPLFRRANAKVVLALAAWAGAALVVYSTVARARKELFTDVGPGDYTLLDRVTSHQKTPRDAFEFLSRNGFRPKVLTEWKIAGPLLLAVPGARVFIDGRAQQLYSEAQYLQYSGLINDPSPARVATILRETGTELVLLPRWPVADPLSSTLGQLEDTWLPVFDSLRATMWVDKWSRVGKDLIRREQSGELWWPDSAYAELRRGAILVASRPPQFDKAVELWRSAIRRKPILGMVGYGWIAKVMRNQGRVAEAATYLQSERERVAALGRSLSDQDRATLLESLRSSEALLAPAAAPDGSPRTDPVTGL